MDWLIGKAYKTRAGDKAVLVLKDGIVSPLLFRHECDGVLLCHSKGGVFNTGGSGRDIIAEWTDEPDEPEPLDLAALAKQHGITITVAVGEISMTFDGRN